MPAVITVTINTARLETDNKLNAFTVMERWVTATRLHVQTSYPGAALSLWLSPGHAEITVTGFNGPQHTNTSVAEEIAQHQAVLDRQVTRWLAELDDEAQEHAAFIAAPAAREVR